MFKWLKEWLFDVPSQTFRRLVPLEKYTKAQLSTINFAHLEKYTKAQLNKINLVEYPTGKDLTPEDYTPEQPKTYPGAWQLGDMCHECGWVVGQPRSWNIYSRYVCPCCGAIDPTQHEVVFRIHTLEIVNTKLDHHMEVKK